MNLVWENVHAYICEIKSRNCIKKVAEIFLVEICLSNCNKNRPNGNKV